VSNSTSNDQIMPPSVDDSGSSRRWFLGAAAAVTAGGVLAACGNNDTDTDSGAGTTVTTGGAATTATTAASGAGDAKVAALAAGLEVLAVGTYKAALEAATANKLGAVPPAVATFAKTAMGHHQTALEAWNKVLTSGGGQAVSTPPASLKATVDKEFAAVKDVTGVAKLALLLEQTAADTYLGATQTLTGKEALTMAGALQIVDQEHAAILLFVLGQYPVPDVFQKTDMAFKG
jgi:hypothetical protein